MMKDSGSLALKFFLPQNLNIILKSLCRMCSTTLGMSRSMMMMVDLRISQDSGQSSKRARTSQDSCWLILWLHLMRSVKTSACMRNIAYCQECLMNLMAIWVMYLKRAQCRNRVPRISASFPQISSSFTSTSIWLGRSKALQMYTACIRCSTLTLMHLQSTSCIQNSQLLMILSVSWYKNPLVSCVRYRVWVELLRKFLQKIKHEVRRGENFLTSSSCGGSSLQLLLLMGGSSTTRY